MPTEVLSAADAAKRIRSCTKAGQNVLGVDGFQIVPDGHVGRLDLVLNLSVRPMAAEDAAAVALQFIAAHGADGIMFEVVPAPKAPVR